MRSTDYYSRQAEEQERWGGRIGGGAAVAYRAYQAHHPTAAIYFQTYNGRTVWMTSKQVAIWHYVRNRKGRLLTLADVAEWVHCAPSTVSRFLHRLEKWHWIDLLVLRGPGGGVGILTAKSHVNPLNVVRNTARIHRSRLAQWRKAADALIRKTQGTRPVDIRMQVLAVQTLLGW